MSLGAIETKRSVGTADYARGAPVPWWAKIGAKIVLSRLPLGYRLWRRLGLFRHGDTDDNVAKVVEGFAAHVRHYQAASGDPLRFVVELGPGDSVGRAVCAAAYGVERTILIDVGDFATTDLRHYRNVADWTARGGMKPPDLTSARNRDEVLALCRAEYRTDGLAAFRTAPDASVDLILSEAVLEHLPYGEFDAFLRESFRVLRPGGVASHVVDLQDHLGGALENLRFPQALWESRFMAQSGFYTNRIRYRDMVERAQRTGFEVAIPYIAEWPALPTPRAAMDPAFRDLEEADLKVSGFGLLLQKPRSR